MKSKFTRITALLLSLLMLAAMLASCGKSSGDEEGNVPVVDLELPSTSSTDPIYVPGEDENETNTETDPSTEGDPSSETETENTTEEAAKAKTTSNVNLRDAATQENSTIIMQLPKGAVVTLLDTSNSDWFKVSYNGQEGYVKSEYLDTNPSSTEMDLKGKVTAGSLNIRESASKDAKAIGSVTKGDIVTIVGTEDGWYKIKNGNGFGFVSSEFVTVIED